MYFYTTKHTTQKIKFTYKKLQETSKQLFKTMPSTNEQLVKPPLEQLPLRLKNTTDSSTLFSFESCAVAVQYWVLRPQTKSYT